MRLLPAVAAAILVAGCAAASTKPGPSGPPEGVWRQQAHAIPVTSADGTQTLLAGRICRPRGDGPSGLVVIAHGSPPVAADRATMQLTNCNAEAARWFLERGFAVAFALRRGYGATGGGYYESNSPCTVDRYLTSAHEVARDLEAVIAYATALDFIRRDGVVVVGQSAGGWGTLGLDSEQPPGVIAYVSMAGGRGGHLNNTPNLNCHPENLIAAAGVLGQKAATPMLWIFTQNDSFFAPSISQPMQLAFVQGGGKLTYDLLPAFDGDGHRLFFGPGGSAIWGKPMEQYLRERGAL